MKLNFFLLTVAAFFLFAESANAQNSHTAVTVSYSDASSDSSLECLDLTLSGPSGSGNTYASFTLGESVLLVSANKLSSYTISFEPPAGYDMLIDGTKKRHIVQPSIPSALIHRYHRISLVKRARQDEKKNEQPVGDAGTISWGAPVSSGVFDEGPCLEFNLGLASNGEPMPPLRVPLGLRGYGWLNLDSFIPPSYPEVQSSAIPGGGVRMVTSSLEVNLTPDQGSALGFRVVFSKLGSAAPFVSYYIDSSSATKSVHLENGLVDTYQTNITFESDPPNYILNGWRINDWHKTGATPVRTIYIKRRFVEQLPPVAPNQYYPHRYRFADTIETSDNGVLITRTFQQYRAFIVEIVDDDGNASGEKTIIELEKVIEGYDSNSPAAGYTTNYSLPNDNTGVFHNIFPSGFARVQDRDDYNYLRTWESWLDSSPGWSGFGGCVQTEKLFTADMRWVGLDLPTSIIKKTPSFQEMEKTQVTYSEGTAAGYPLVPLNQPNLVVSTRADYASSINYLTTITKKFHPSVADYALRDRLYAVVSPDGTQQSYAYTRGTFVYSPSNGTGTFTPTVNGTDFSVAILQGLVAGGNRVTRLNFYGTPIEIEEIGLVVGRTTKNVQILQAGRVVRSEVYAYIGGAGTAPNFELLSWDEYKYTPAGRLLERRKSNGSYYKATWLGSRKIDETDETGVITTFTSYDGMDRLLSSTRESVGSLPAVSTTYSYGKTETTTIGLGADALVSSKEFDLGRRLIKKTEHGSIVTSYVYSNGNGERDVTENHFAGTPDAATKVVTRFADGRIKSITGSKVVNEFHSYSFEEGLNCHTVRMGSLTGRRQQEFTDWLGRIVKKSTDGFGPNGAQNPIVTYYDYNERGQCWRERTVVKNPNERTIAAPLVRHFDDFGKITAEGLDLDANNILEPLSTDRYSSFTELLEKDLGGSWWKKTTRNQFYTNNATGAHTSTESERLSGFPSGLLSQTNITDIFGRPAGTTVTVDASNKIRRENSYAPDGTSTSRVIIAGLVSGVYSYSDNSQTPEQSTTYTYDSLGRTTHSTDLRRGTRRNSFYSGTSRVQYSYDERDRLIAAYEYDGAGRPRRILDAAGNETILAYNGRGQVTQKSGAGKHPVTYRYDDYGQQDLMNTYRQGLGGAADSTSWLYDTNTGWLVEKTDADGKKTKYDYSYIEDQLGAYKRIVRTWARCIPNTTTNVTTTSDYSAFTGELLSTTYNDGTPQVSYGYTRTGKIAWVTDATGSRDFTYDHELIKHEFFDDDWYASRVLTHQYQSTTSIVNNSLEGRYAGIKLGLSTDSEHDLAVSYRYDDLARISGLTSSYKAQGGRPALSADFTYRYKENSSLWDKITDTTSGGTGYAFEKKYEANRDVLTESTATQGGAILTRYTYQTDDDGRREWAKQDGAYFADLPEGSYWRYGYDSRNQLTSATGHLGGNPSATTDPLPGRALGYDYDTAGNRKSVTVDTESVSYVNDSGALGGNKLNQISSRGTLHARISGSAHAALPVSVGGVVANRRNRYFDAQVPVSFGQYAQVTISTSAQSVTRYVLQKPATEAFSYDADGNLVQDALWSYRWDAENRLISMTTLATWGAPNRTLTFTYDYLGRRVQKQSVDTTYGTSTTTRYIYQGWNLLAEYIVTGSSNLSLGRSYAWGLDVRSRLSVTGNPGGLVLAVAHTSSAYIPYRIAYDGGGNVAALVKGDSTYAALYEYDPYGQVIRVEGTEAINNPFRHSTRYYDQESGLYFYGKRYYSPSLGTFVNRDPIEEAGGANLYAFVSNNVTNSWDYLGLSEVDGQENKQSWLKEIAQKLKDLMIGKSEEKTEEEKPRAERPNLEKERAETDPGKAATDNTGQANIIGPGSEGAGVSSPDGALTGAAQSAPASGNDSLSYARKFHMTFAFERGFDKKKALTFVGNMQKVVDAYSIKNQVAGIRVDAKFSSVTIEQPAGGRWSSGVRVSSYTSLVTDGVGTIFILASSPVSQPNRAILGGFASENVGGVIGSNGRDMVLPHEVGHVLGWRSNEQGQKDKLHSSDPTNIMHSPSPSDGAIDGQYYQRLFNKSTPIE
jgi:RHS repeat-associated protein